MKSPTQMATHPVEGRIDLSLAKHNITIAWEQYKKSTVKHFRDGLDFGRACHEWRMAYKAQGSRRGKGFEHLLEQLGIPKTTAYRWIRRYEVKVGLRASRNDVHLSRRVSRGRVSGRQVESSGNPFSNLQMTDQQRRQFEEDVALLGGLESVLDMFLDFVSQKALERRTAISMKHAMGSGGPQVRIVASA